MSIQAAVGQSRLTTSFEAGSQAARAALDGLQGSAPGLAIVFATCEYDQEDLLSGIGDVIGDVALSGCSGEGIIAHSESLECDYAVGVMLLSSSTLQFETFLLRNYGDDPAACGAELAAIVGSRDDAIGLLVFPDGLVGNCTRFLAELESNLELPLPVSGGTSADGMAFKQTFQYGNEGVVSVARSALKAMGAAQVIMVDVLDKRLDVAKRFGADYVINAEALGEDALVEAIRERTGGLGADLLIEVVGLAPVVETGVKMLRIGGRYLLHGAVYPHDTFTLQAHDVITKCLSLFGLHNYDARHLKMAMNLVHRTRETYPYSELAGPRFPLPAEGVTEALLALERREGIRPIVEPGPVTAASSRQTAAGCRNHDVRN